MIDPKLERRILDFLRAGPRTGSQIYDEILGRWTRPQIAHALAALRDEKKINGDGPGRLTYEINPNPPVAPGADGTGPALVPCDMPLDEAGIEAHLAALGAVGDRIRELARRSGVALALLLNGNKGHAIAAVRTQLAHELCDKHRLNPVQIADALRVRASSIRYRLHEKREAAA